MPRKVFVAGEILTAADVNTNLMDQAVMVFDDSTARGSAIPSPSEGMVTYLKDVNQVQAYDGSSFTPVGTILQVVSNAKVDAFSTTSSSYVQITGLTASITPSSSSSKILVFAKVFLSAATARVFLGLRRGGTEIFVSTAGGTDNGTTFLAAESSALASREVLDSTIVFVDSPATTSATTYEIAMKCEGGATGTVNRWALNTDWGAASSITVMEVAG